MAASPEVMGGLHHLPIVADVSSRLAQRGIPLPRLALGLSAAWRVAPGALMAGSLQAAATTA